ncbi:PREDICTED: transport and Golgi organization protein 2 homolog isoform X2 [Papilio polytes]|uniref:transport and Golgi organization protein 2 homolog isoform X2 n=1 Tax=Papilio polytes TaxID=76194 RepID=UPI0006760BB6|nr:PREDICTED: transport and Golgi organization protein 2 homolog isoform X2 [Papilio polytes]
MCIVFIYVGSNDADSEYKLILISNRDEFYDRPSQNMSPWEEDVNIYGGRDLQTGCEGGTWLALSTYNKKIGLLLNLPGVHKDNAKSRGKVVENYVKGDIKLISFVDSMKQHFQECNEFVLVAVEFGNVIPTVQTYNNGNNELKQWHDQYLGFSNSLPDQPLTKVEAGKCKLQDACNKYKKINNKDKLIEELIAVLKSEKSNLPDPQLEERRPQIFKELSSIFVKIPKARYGTRTHTIILLTKTGEMDIIEMSMKSPIDPLEPTWNNVTFSWHTQHKNSKQ